MNPHQIDSNPASAWEVSGDLIRQRVIEYLGGDSLNSVTSAFLASCDEKDPRKIRKHDFASLSDLLGKGTSLARSLDDSKSALIHLDIEYVNFDDPAAAFTDPWHAFSVQQPVVQVIEELLVTWGIRPLHLITGQGHHFVWKIPKGSPCCFQLGNLALPHQNGEGPTQSDLLFDGTSLLMDYFAIKVKELAAPRCELPVELTAVHVGPGSTRPREMISLDISEYGDPLESRTIRIPFTAYRKPWVCGMVSDLGLDDQIGHFVTLPLHEMDVMQCLKFRQDGNDIASLAKCTSMHIPDQADGTSRLIAEYQSSRLRDFHKFFYRERHLDEAQLDSIYRDDRRYPLPGCVGHALIFPNDILLKPAIFQLVTRCFLARGWHPRHIAGLIGSKFSNPAYNWGTAWEGYSPARRADFYVRIFSGLIALGKDEMIDFNCTSQQEKGFCWPSKAQCSLQSCHDILISKIKSND